MRYLAILLALTVLVACGSAPAAQEGTPAQSSLLATLPATIATSDQPTAAPVATAPPTTTPEAAPSAVSATDAPVASPRSAGASDLVRLGYLTLVYLKASAVILEDTVQQVQAGTLKGFESFGRLIVIGALLKASGENLAKPPPDPALQNAWEQAKPLYTQLGEILGQLTDKKITAADVPAKLTPLQAAIDQMLGTAEQDLAAQHGVDAEKLHQIRDEAIADLRKSLQETPTPAPAEPTTAPAGGAADSGAVSRELLADKWPLTVDSGTLHCTDQAVTFESGGTIYALNGTAKQRAKANSWQDITPIWADNPSVAGLKKDIGPLIERGLALC